MTISPACYRSTKEIAQVHETGKDIQGGQAVSHAHTPFDCKAFRMWFNDLWENPQFWRTLNAENGNVQDWKYLWETQWSCYKFFFCEYAVFQLFLCFTCGSCKIVNCSSAYCQVLTELLLFSIMAFLRVPLIFTVNDFLELDNFFFSVYIYIFWIHVKFCI